MSIDYKPHGKSERTVEARCDVCSGLCDGIYQRADANGTWGPDEFAMLKALGWLTRDGKTFCGRHCEQRDAYHTRMTATQPVAVTRPILPKLTPPTVQPRAAAKR